MRETINHLTSFLVVLFAFAAITWWIWNKSSTETNKQKYTHNQMGITTIHPAKKNFFSLKKFFGHVESKEIVNITSQIEGRITSIAIKDGAKVRKGTLLFTLGGSQVEKCKSFLLKRVNSLEKKVNLASKALSLKKEAFSEKLVTKAEVLQAKNELNAALLSLQKARKDLALYNYYINIFSPISGVFTNRKVCEGQIVEKGTHLAQIISTLQKKVVGYLFSNQGIFLKNKQVLITTTDNIKIKAKISRVLPEIDSTGATVVWIEGSDINKYLHVGEPVMGHIVLQIHEKAIALPDDAIVRDEKEHTFVFLKTDKGYKKHPIKTGLVAKGSVEIINGLSEKDEVVLHGAYELLHRDFNKIYKVVD